MLKDAPKRKRAVKGSKKTTEFAVEKIVESFDSDSDDADFLLDKPAPKKKEAIGVGSASSTKDAMSQDAPKRKRVVTSSKATKPTAKEVFDSDSDDSFSLM